MTVKVLGDLFKSPELRMDLAMTLIERYDQIQTSSAYNPKVLVQTEFSDFFKTITSEKILLAILNSDYFVNYLVLVNQNIKIFMGYQGKFECNLP